MLDVFRELFALLNKREKKRFYILVVLMLIVSVAEVFGISTILVLLKVLTEPELINENQSLRWTYETFGFTSRGSFEIGMCFAVFLAVVIGLIIKAFGNYAIVRYSTMRGFTISGKLLEAYLHQPYAWFLQRNSSDISKTVLTEVARLVNSVLVPAMRMLASIILAVSLLAFLTYMEPVIALVSVSVIGGGYTLIYLRLRKTMMRYGKDINLANAQRFRLTQEATGGFKELKLLGLEGVFVKRFLKPAYRSASRSAMLQMMSQMPRFGLEALTFAILIGSILFLQIKNDGDMAAAVPVLGTFAFTVMRLLPALQQVYGGFSSIRSGKPLLESISKDYQAARLAMRDRPKSAAKQERLSITQQLEVRDAVFSYPDTDRAALRGLNLTIPAKSTVGIVGGTGAGKTTVIDTMLGLLTLDSGSIMVDGVAIDRENVQSWRNALGYVPQAIFLTDNSIAENIAFGVDAAEIDMAAVEEAASIAALTSFVTEELPEGFQTLVGERGVRLSGGQRQRIGIARALYHNPELLILDEATSALDNLTERAVMDAVHNIGHQKTVIMIAHRLSTVRECDQVYLLENGKLSAQGTFDELVEKSDTFRAMAANA